MTMTMTTADWHDWQEYDGLDGGSVYDVADDMTPCTGCGSYQPQEWLDAAGGCARCADEGGRVHLPVGAGTAAP